jgi:hypothetical protein
MGFLLFCLGFLSGAMGMYGLIAWFVVNDFKSAMKEIDDSEA